MRREAQCNEMHFVLEMLQGYATQLEMMHYFAGIMKCVTRIR